MRINNICWQLPVSPACRPKGAQLVISTQNQLNLKLGILPKVTTAWRGRGTQWYTTMKNGQLRLSNWEYQLPYQKLVASSLEDTHNTMLVMDFSTRRSKILRRFTWRRFRLQFIFQERSQMQRFTKTLQWCTAQVQNIRKSDSTPQKSPCAGPGFLPGKRKPPSLINIKAYKSQIYIIYIRSVWLHRFTNPNLYLATPPWHTSSSWG